MDGRFRGGQVELHQLLPHFLHRNPFCLMGLWMMFVDRLIEPRARAPAELLRTESRDIHEKKAIRDRRCRLDRFIRLNGFFYLRRFEFHNNIGYRNLRRISNSGIRDLGLGIRRVWWGFGPN